MTCPCREIARWADDVHGHRQDDTEGGRSGGEAGPVQIGPIMPIISRATGFRLREPRSVRRGEKLPTRLRISSGFIQATTAT